MHFEPPDLAAANRIDLGRGYWCVVDAADYPRLTRYRWRASSDGEGHVYARARIGGKQRLLHRILAEAEDQLDLETGRWRTVGRVDHKNGDSLDCRRSNLRSCSNA